MISVEDQIRMGFRELGLEHEAAWVWDHVHKHTSEFLEAQSLAQNILERRRGGEPLAYVLGEWPFLNFVLTIDRGVLIPRPETEELADRVVKLVAENPRLSRQANLKILDLGAGSGALGIGVADALLGCLSTLKIELHSVERSEAAQKILSQNLEKLNNRYSGRVSIIEHMISWNDLPVELNGVDVVLGNPPYVSQSEWQTHVDNSVKNFEPHVALIPESATRSQATLAAKLQLSVDDLSRLAIGPLLENLEVAKTVLAPGGLLAIEMGPAQADAFAAEWQSAAEAYFNVRLRVVRDLSSKLRFLIGNQYG